MKNSNSGFTLIEVLIAVVILSTGLVLVLQGMQTGVMAFDSAVSKSRAAVLIGGKLSELRQEALAGVDLSTLESRGDFEAPYELYHWSQSIERVSKDVSAGAGASGEGKDAGELYRIEVVVGRTGSEREYSLVTYVYTPPAGCGSPGAADGSAGESL
jgi:prepilin-type N-terminal cleavage/methylation domain-containing protein